jgi:pimeloyl-ACP methyl ester carboxylesterase
MAYFKFDNNNVYYKIVGNGKPLLLLHGNTVSSKMFNSILKVYSKNHKVITLDFPGHGKSSRLDKFETDF